MEDQDRAITGESSRTEDDGPPIHAICDGLLSEILGRLPTRNVFQLRLVCKRWRTLLEDPIFPRIHASLFKISPSWLLFFPSRFVFDLSVPSVRDPILLIRRRQVPLGCRPLSVVAGCDGLLLCTNLTTTRYYVVNELTREFVSIRPPPPNFRTHGRGLVVSSDEGGFIMRSFHVVLLCEKFYSRRRFRKIVFWTFCSSDGMWRRRDFPFRSDWLVIHGYIPPPTPYKGVLYWIVWCNLTIIAYDTFKNPHECYWIRLPGPWGQIGVSRRRRNCCLCGIMEGQFCFFDEHRLWILENYRQGEWRQDLSIPPVENRFVIDYRLWRVHSMFVPVAFNPFAKGVVCRCGYSLAYENLETRHMRFMCSFQDAPLTYEGVFPFVSPFWPSRIPRFSEFVHGWLHNEGYSTGE